MNIQSKYRPDIDGLRAIAVLAVVAFHAAPGRLPGGFIGVDVFFVISGFLISSILLSSLEKGKFSILEFYERRVRRIFPALFVVIFTCAVTGWFFLLPSEYLELGKHIVAGTVFVSNIALWDESGYFDISAMFKPLLHLWSLGIEEQFYIFWPLILWLAYKKKWSIPLTISALAIASFILNIYLTDADKSSAFYLPFPRFWELLVGALLASTLTMRSKFDSQLLSNIQSIIGLVFLAAGFFLISEAGAFPGWWALLPVTGSAFLISAGPQAIFNRWILSNQIMVWVGLISYPLYLWHWPILSFLRILEGQEILQIHRAIAVATSFVLAWLTYGFIEKPVRNSAQKSSTILLFLGLMAAIGLFGASIYFTNGFNNRSGNLPIVVNAGDINETEYSEYSKLHYFPCTPESIRLKIVPWQGTVRCFQSKMESKKTIAIIGDSHAEHLFVGLADALKYENIVMYPIGNIPFTSNKNLPDLFPYILNDPNIKIVVLSSFWEQRFSEIGNAEWELELEETVQTLSQAGKYIFITDDVPNFTFIPSRCKFSGRLGIENKCTDINDRAYLKYRSKFEALSEKYPNLHVIHTYESFCYFDTCSMAKDGLILYRDKNHLNINGSREIGRIIAAQIAKVIQNNE